jgi:hypothetical protein
MTTRPDEILKCRAVAAAAFFRGDGLPAGYASRWPEERVV